MSIFNRMGKRKRNCKDTDDTHNIDDHPDETNKVARLDYEEDSPPSPTLPSVSPHTPLSPTQFSSSGKTLEETKEPAREMAENASLETLPSTSSGSLNVATDSSCRSIRTSARVQSKQLKKEEEKCEAVVRKTEISDDEDETTEPHKKRRQWELWAPDLKNLFFEAVNVYGKNFESIQRYIDTKARKKGYRSSLIKNKDQVRHFYYRTWHKISKHITFSGAIKKSTKEVYGLVNYGEFRRRVGDLSMRVGDVKVVDKFRELVLNGTASIRYKGKTLRLRTPVCRALKKINQPLDRSSDTPMMPLSVTVMLTPASHSAHSRVHAMAHNPRVKMLMALDRPLESLLKHLQDKWREPAFKKRDALLSSSSSIFSVPSVSEAVLRITPPQDAKITVSRVRKNVITRSTIPPLLDYVAGVEKAGGYTYIRPKRRKKKKIQKVEKHVIVEDFSQEDTEGSEGEDLYSKPREEQRSKESAKEESGVMIEEFVDTFSGDYLASALTKSDIMNGEERLLKEEEEMVCSESDILRQLAQLNGCQEENKEKENSENLIEGNKEEMLGEEEKSANKEEMIEEEEKSANKEEMIEEEEKSANKEEMIEEEEKSTELSPDELTQFTQSVKKGWTLQSVGKLTVGELFVMLGQQQPLHLEYEFEETIGDEKVEPLRLDDTGKYKDSTAVSGMFSHLLSMTKQLMNSKKVILPEANMPLACSCGAKSSLRSPRTVPTAVIPSSKSPRGLHGERKVASAKRSLLSGDTWQQPDQCTSFNVLIGDSSQPITVNSSNLPSAEEPIKVQFRVPVVPPMRSSSEDQLSNLGRYTGRSRRMLQRKNQVVPRQRFQTKPLVIKQKLITTKSNQSTNHAVPHNKTLDADISKCSFDSSAISVNVSGQSILKVQLPEVPPVSSCEASVVPSVSSVSTLDVDSLLHMPSLSNLATTPLSSPNKDSLLTTPVLSSFKQTVNAHQLNSVTKNISSLLDSSRDSSMLEALPKNLSLLGSNDSSLLPSIHLPDCSAQLPVLDISLGASFGLHYDKIRVKKPVTEPMTFENIAESISNSKESITSTPRSNSSKAAVDHLFEMGNSNSTFTELFGHSTPPHFTDSSPSSSLLNTPRRSNPVDKSPCRLSKDNLQWGEDLSISSLLGAMGGGNHQIDQMEQAGQNMMVQQIGQPNPMDGQIDQFNLLENQMGQLIPGPLIQQMDQVDNRQTISNIGQVFHNTDMLNQKLNGNVSMSDQLLASMNENGVDFTAKFDALSNQRR